MHVLIAISAHLLNQDHATIFPSLQYLHHFSLIKNCITHHLHFSYLLTMSCTAFSGLQSCLDPTTHSKNWTDIKQSMKMQSVVYRPFFNLDLCTENLGCETGAVDFSSSFFHADHEDQKERQPINPPTRVRSRESPRTTILPPSLTTISHVKVRARREGGRLLLRAVSLPSPASICLLAERSGGRLTLRFQGDFRFKYNQKDEFKRTRNGGGEEETGQSIEKEVSKKKKQVVFQEEKDGSSETDMNKFEDSGGGEAGTLESLRRPSRCIESGPENKGLPFRKLYLVTTST